MSYRARPAGAAAEGEWRVPLALPNLEGYSLALAPKRLANFFISRRRLLDDFGKHYKGELMRNLLSGKVLLHADLSSVVSDKVAAMAGGGRAAAPALPAPGEVREGPPRHVAEGVLQGGLGLGRGLLGGLTGLVAAPLSGAREGAAEGKALAGFARGLGRGLVGALTRTRARARGRTVTPSLTLSLTLTLPPASPEKVQLLSSISFLLF